MGTIDTENKKVEFAIIAAELMNVSLLRPNVIVEPQVTFTFDIRLDNKVDFTTKNIIVTVDITIFEVVKDTNVERGSISVGCMYNIKNFDEIVTLDNNKKVDMPSIVGEVLNSISLSTTRGVMLSQFRGTYLHNAILPVVNPRDFKPNIDEWVDSKV